MRLLSLLCFISCSNFNKNRDLTKKQFQKSSNFIEKIDQLSTPKADYRKAFSFFFQDTIPKFLHRNFPGFKLKTTLPKVENEQTNEITSLLSLCITYLEGKNNSEHKKLFEEIVEKISKKIDITVDGLRIIIDKKNETGKEESKTPFITISYPLKEGEPTPFLLQYILISLESLESKENKNLNLNELGSDEESFVPYNTIDENLLKKLSYFKSISFLKKNGTVNKENSITFNPINNEKHLITLNDNILEESFFLSKSLIPYKLNHLKKIRAFLKKTEYKKHNIVKEDAQNDNQAILIKMIDTFDSIYKNFKSSFHKNKVISSQNPSISKKDPRYKKNIKHKNFELSRFFSEIHKYDINKLSINYENSNIDIDNLKNIRNYLPLLKNQSSKNELSYNSKDKTKDFHSFLSILPLKTHQKIAQGNGKDKIVKNKLSKEIKSIRIIQEKGSEEETILTPTAIVIDNSNERCIVVKQNGMKFELKSKSLKSENTYHNNSSSLVDLIDRTLIPDIKALKEPNVFSVEYLSKNTQEQEEYLKKEFILKSPLFVQFHYFIEKVTNTLLKKKYEKKNEQKKDENSILDLSILNLNAYLLFHHRLKNDIPKNYNFEKYSKIVEKNAKDITKHLEKEGFGKENPPNILTFQEIFPLNQAVFSKENKSLWNKDIENKTVQIYQDKLNAFYPGANYVAVVELPQKAQEYDFSFFDLMQPHSLESFAASLDKFGVLTMKPTIKRVLDDVDLQVNPGPSGLVIFYNQKAMEEKNINFEGSFFKSFATKTQDYNNLIPLSRGILEAVFSFEEGNKKKYFTVNTSHFSTDDSFIIERIHQTTEFINFTTNFSVEEEKKLFVKRTNHLLGTNLNYESLIAHLNTLYPEAITSGAKKIGHGDNIANFFTTKEKEKFFTLSLFDGNFDPLGDVLIDDPDNYNLTKVPAQLLIESQKFVFLNSLMEDPFTISYLKDDNGNFIKKSNIIDKEIEKFSEGGEFFIPKAHFHRFTTYSHQMSELYKTILKNFLKSPKESVDSKPTDTVFSGVFNKQIKEYQSLFFQIKKTLILIMDHIKSIDFSNQSSAIAGFMGALGKLEGFFDFDSMSNIKKTNFLRDQYKIEALNTKLPLGKSIDHALLYINKDNSSNLTVVPCEVKNFSNKASDHEGILIKKLSIYNK